MYSLKKKSSFQSKVFSYVFVSYVAFLQNKFSFDIRCLNIVDSVGEPYKKKSFVVSSLGISLVESAGSKLKCPVLETAKEVCCLSSKHVWQI